MRSEVERERETDTDIDTWFIASDTDLFTTRRGNRGGGGGYILLRSTFLKFKHKSFLLQPSFSITVDDMKTF